MKNITQLLLVFLFPLLSMAQEQLKDPFQKGAYPPFHRMYTWEEFFNKYEKIDGNLITIYGWLEVKKVPSLKDFELVVKIYKNLDSKKVGFVQDALVLKLSAKTFEAYKDAKLDDWMSLDNKAAYVTGYFKLNLEELDDGIKGVIAEPVLINTPAKMTLTKENFGSIMTKDAIWK